MAGLLNSSIASAGQGSPQATPPMAPGSAPGSIAPGKGFQSKATPSGAFKDPILKKIEAQLIAKLAPNLHSEYQSAVNAGLNIIYGKQMGSKIMSQFQSSQNPQADITKLIANVFATIINEVIGKMSPAKRQQYEGTFMPSLLAASATLTCHLLDTLEQMGKFQLNAQSAGQMIQVTSFACLQKIGISPQQVQQIIAQRGANQGAK